MTLTGATTTTTSAGPLPAAGRGELSKAGRGPALGRPPVVRPRLRTGRRPLRGGPPAALHLLYELHYRGFDGVDDEREWDPDLLRLRRAMGNRFLDALRTNLPDVPRSVEEVFAPLLEELVDLSGSLSHHLETRGELWQLREYAVLRSLYHLKEADPHAWVIPRLTDGPRPPWWPSSTTSSVPAGPPASTRGSSRTS